MKAIIPRHKAREHTLGGSIMRSGQTRLNARGRPVKTFICGEKEKAPKLSPRRSESIRLLRFDQPEITISGGRTRRIRSPCDVLNISIAAIHDTR
jgi:hypothetical protein